MTRKLSALPGIVILFVNTIGLSEDSRALESAEIELLLEGNTIHGIGEESGWFFVIYYKPGGSVSGMSSPYEGSSHIEYDDGQWEVTLDRGYCLIWNNFKGGIERCMDMIPRGDSYEFITKDGSRQSIVTIHRGNPDNL